MRKPQPCVCCCNMSTAMTLCEQSHYLVSCPNTMFSKQNWHQLLFMEDYIPQPLSASLQVMTTFKTKNRWAHEVLDTLLEPDCSVWWGDPVTCSEVMTQQKKLSIYQFSQLRSPLWWECTGPCPGPSASGRPRLPKRSCKSTNPKASTLHLHTANCCSRIFSDILWVRAVRGRSHTLHAYVPGCMASTLITSTWDHWLGSGHLGHAQTCSELQLYLAGLSSGFGSDKT